MDDPKRLRLLKKKKTEGYTEKFLKEMEEEREQKKADDAENVKKRKAKKRERNLKYYQNNRQRIIKKITEYQKVYHSTLKKQRDESRIHSCSGCNKLYSNNSNLTKHTKFYCTNSNK